MQPQAKKGEPNAYCGVMTGLKRMWKEEGFQGLMRGNGINCLRIAPYSAVQFTTYEAMKRWLQHPVHKRVRGADGTMRETTTNELGAIPKLIAGATAGIASVVSTYPLDLVRSRISIATASLHTAGSRDAALVQARIPSIAEMTEKVYAEEGGLRGLYRGCVPTAAGVAPYVAFNFFFYENARSFFTKSDGTPPSALIKLLCGAWAGAVSQTLTYPLDVIRRRMQVAGMRNSSLGYSDRSGIDAIRNIVRKNGVRGLYYGLLPNLLKVTPSMGTSFFVYELVRNLIESVESEA